MMKKNIDIQAFYEPQAGSFMYLISDILQKKCIVIDPILQCVQKMSNLNTANVACLALNTYLLDDVIQKIQQQQLELCWILETHPHADHVSGAKYLQQKAGGKIAIGEHVVFVQKHWLPQYPQTKNAAHDGSQFDVLLHDLQIITSGDIQIQALHTAGHTPACMSYYIEGLAIFVGDVLLGQGLGEFGTGRADFIGGDAHALYQSAQKILQLPDDVNIYVNHDYPAENAAPSAFASVATHRLHNKILHGASEEQYVQKRQARDNGKAAPSLFYPAIPYNLSFDASLLPNIILYNNDVII